MSDASLTDEELQRLRMLLSAAQGVDLSFYTSNFLARRVNARMRMFELGKTSQYIDRLEKDPVELNALIGALTVNVTEFFRDAEVYETLRTKVMPVLTAAGARRIQVWSAGCATGQEPYTLAMMLDEALSVRPGFTWTIHASDISPRQLEAAQAAVYPIESVRHVPPRHLKRYFTMTDDGRVAVSQALRANIKFHQHDLSAGIPLLPNPVDLILCRNVMIYFSMDAKEKLLEFFHRCLVKDGFLVLGASEVILKDKLFKPFDVKNKIYRAIASTSAPATGDR